MVLLEVTWIFSFHPQALSLILADRQHWKCWEFSSSPGAVQHLPQRWQEGTPVLSLSTCPEGLVFPEDAQLCPDCPHHGHPAPGEPQNLCRTQGELSGGCPDLTQPSTESQTRGCQRNGSSSSLPSGDARPFPGLGSHLEPPSLSLQAARGTSAL